MSAGCVRWMLSHTARAVCGGSRGYWTAASRFTTPGERSNVIASSWTWSTFSTAVDDTEQTLTPKKKNSHDPKAHATISSVGRKIPHRQIQVISETGENLGTKHRADVIKIMDERGLKLVLLSESKDPPVYRLMSGTQIHEERMKLREKQKAKPAPVQVKELTLTLGIAEHDLATKMKQVEGWLKKKDHVRITLRSRRREPAVDLDTSLEQIVQQTEVMVGFVSKPRVIRDGQAAMCILRPPSAKELKHKNQDAALRSDDSTSSSTESETPAPPVSNIDTTEGTIQQ